MSFREATERLPKSPNVAKQSGIERRLSRIMGDAWGYFQSMAKRGSAIKVPESWLEQCRQWRDDQGLSLAETGVRLARAIRRGRSFGNSTIHRYLNGHLVTDEITRAFAKVMGVGYPIQVLESEKQQRWCALGARLDTADAETFEVELDRLERLVDMAEALRAYRSK